MVPALPRHVMPSFPLCFYGPRLPAALAGVLAPQHKHAHSTRPALAQPPNLPAHGTPQEIVIARSIRRLCNQRDCHLRDVCNQPIRGQEIVTSEVQEHGARVLEVADPCVGEARHRRAVNHAVVGAPRDLQDTGKGEGRSCGEGESSVARKRAKRPAAAARQARGYGQRASSAHAPLNV